MIQPHELRIGNWVKYNRMDDESISLQIIEISKNDNFEDCEPIPLTPEILEKAGFENVTDNILFRIDNIETWQSMFNSVKIAKVVLCGNDMMGNDECYAYPRQSYGQWKAIRSLHQLQNLYFALTGEELEIKL